MRKKIKKTKFTFCDLDRYCFINTTILKREYIIFLIFLSKYSFIPNKKIEQNVTINLLWQPLDTKSNNYISE